VKWARKATFAPLPFSDILCIPNFFPSTSSPVPPTQHSILHNEISHGCLVPWSVYLSDEILIQLKPFFPWRWGGSSTQAWVPTFYVSILRIPQMIWVWRATVEWYWQGKPEELGEKHVPVPLCPPQVPNGLTWARTWASAVTGRQLTTWAISWSLTVT
jgi:hypothetical protein